MGSHQLKKFGNHSLSEICILSPDSLLVKKDSGGGGIYTSLISESKEQTIYAETAHLYEPRIVLLRHAFLSNVFLK